MPVGAVGAAGPPPCRRACGGETPCRTPAADSRLGFWRGPLAVALRPSSPACRLPGGVARPRARRPCAAASSLVLSSLCPSVLSTCPLRPSARPLGPRPGAFRFPGPPRPDSVSAAAARPPAGVVACGRGPVVPRRHAPLSRARPSASRAPAGRRGPAAAAAPPPGGPGHATGPSPCPRERERASVGFDVTARWPGPASPGRRRGRGGAACALAPPRRPRCAVCVPGPGARGGRHPLAAVASRGAFGAGSVLRHLPSRPRPRPRSRLARPASGTAGPVRAAPRRAACPPHPGACACVRACVRARAVSPTSPAYLVDPASSICLSQRLSHACLSTHGRYSETANGSLNQLWFLWSLAPLLLG